MNEDVKKLWVDALRSGKYEQARGALRKEDGFCCLGVLCDIAKNHIPDCGWKEEHTFAFYSINTYGNVVNATTLPTKVMVWADLKDADPVTYGITLSEWNDTEKKSFVEIANLIEKHL